VGPAFTWANARLAELGAAGASHPAPGHTAGATAWEALPVEASHRSFYRVRVSDNEGPSGTFILMTSPPALEQNDQFLRLAALFGRHRIGVPTVHAHSDAEGWFLLEDLGTRHLADVYGTGEEAAALAGALDTLLGLQRIQDPAVPPYTAARFGDELRIFSDWFVEGLLAERLDAAVTDDLFGLLVENTQVQPQCCVHRDFHCRNLLWRPDGRIGVVDFQDALVGPASYDLASLLRDCYHTFTEAEIARWRDAYLERSPLPLDPAAFPRQLDLTAVQRQLKAVGIFARLELRDGKSTHLHWILPVLDRLIALTAQYGELAPLTAMLRHLRPLAARRLTAGA